MNRCVLPLLSVLVAILLSPWCLANSATESEDVAAIQTLFANYMQKYNHYLVSQQLSAEPILYADQVMLISASRGPSVLETEVLNKQVERFLSALKENGVASVRWEKVHVSLLGDTLALASNVAVRYTEKGDVYNRVGATYYLFKTEQGWRISAFSVHDADKVLAYNQSLPRKGFSGYIAARERDPQ